MLPNMAAGLGSIIFAIPTNETYLNTSSRSVDVPILAVAPPIVQHSSFPVSNVPLSTPSSAIFDPTVRSRVSAAAEEDDDEVVAVTTKEKKKKRKKKSPYMSPRSTSPSLPTRSVPEPELNHLPTKQRKRKWVEPVI